MLDIIITPLSHRHVLIQVWFLFLFFNFGDPTSEDLPPSEHLLSHLELLGLQGHTVSEVSC